MDLVPNKQLLHNVPFRSTKYEKKELSVDNKVRSLSEKCIVQHVEMKSVFTFQPKKRLVSTNVKTAKPPATFWKFLLHTKNRLLCCLAVMIHNVLQESESRPREKKTFSIFEETSPPITTKHIRTWTKKDRSYSIYGNIVSTPQYLI